jgi:hypothetical protein
MYDATKIQELIGFVNKLQEPLKDQTCRTRTPLYLARQNAAMPSLPDRP